MKSFYSQMLAKKLYIPNHLKCVIWKKNNQTFLVIFGLLGLLFLPIRKEVSFSLQSNYLKIVSKINMLVNLNKSIIRNILMIFSCGLKIQLQLRGMGFRSQLKNNQLILKIGYSHLIYFKIPIGIKIKRIKKQKLNIYGITNQLLYQVAEHLRNYRFPDVYKSKGLVYKGESFKLKQGKKKSK